MAFATKIPGLKKAGTFPMLCVEISKDPSKAGRPMLAVLWKSLDPENEGAASQWMVMNLSFGQEAFTKAKIALGLPMTAKGDDLVGNKAMITLRLKEPNAEGKVFSEVVEVKPFDPHWQAKKSLQKPEAAKEEYTTIDF